MAFSRYLVDEIEYALRTTYVGRTLRTGTDHWGNRCEVCEHYAGLAGELRAARRLHEFDDWESRVVDVQELVPSRSGDPTAYWQLRLVLTRPETRVLDDRGAVVHTLPAEPRDTVLVVGSPSRSCGSTCGTS